MPAAGVSPNLLLQMGRNSRMRRQPSVMDAALQGYGRAQNIRLRDQNMQRNQQVMDVTEEERARKEMLFIQGQGDRESAIQRQKAFQQGLANIDLNKEGWQDEVAMLAFQTSGSNEERMQVLKGLRESEKGKIDLETAKAKLKKAQAEARAEIAGGGRGKAPSGFEWKGGKLAPIEGGPKDPQTILDQVKAKEESAHEIKRQRLIDIYGEDKADIIDKQLAGTIDKSTDQLRGDAKYTDRITGEKITSETKSGSESGAPASVAKDFRSAAKSDKQLKGATLGKKTDKGYEVMKNGKKIGYWN